MMLAGLGVCFGIWDVEQVAEYDHGCEEMPRHHNDNPKHTGEQAKPGIESGNLKIAQGFAEFHLKVLAIAYANIDAALAFGRELAGVTSPAEFMELSNKYTRQQIQAMNQQTRELAEIAQKTTLECMGPFGSVLSGAILGRPDLS